MSIMSDIPLSYSSTSISKLRRSDKLWVATKSLHKTQALQGGLLFMELFLLSEITWQTRSFIRFAGPVGDCAIMLAVQRKTENIPIKTNQQKRNTSKYEH